MRKWILAFVLMVGVVFLSANSYHLQAELAPPNLSPALIEV